MDELEPRVSPQNRIAFVMQGAMLRYARLEKDSPAAKEALSEAHAQFGLLYEQTFDDMFTLVSILLRDNKDDIRDVVQQSYQRAFRDIVKFKGNSEYSSWLYRITSNRAYSFLEAENNKHKNVVSVVFDEELIDNTVSAHVPDSVADDLHDFEERKALYEELRASIDKLTPKVRAAIVARYIGGMSISQIAHTYKIGESAVKVRLMRGRRQLAEMMHRGEDKSDSKQ